MGSLRKSPMISPNIYSVMGQDNNMVQRNMENEVSSKRNMYGMVDISSDLMDQDILGRNKMGNDMMGHNMMNENLMGHNLYSNDLSVDMMNRNMMDQDMINHNMMDQEKIGRNMMGHKIASNMGHNRMNSYSSDIDRLPLGQHNTMSKRMEMIPQSRAANRLF